MSPPPARAKIYHIVHIDRLQHILADGCLWCDAVIGRRPETGTTIGMSKIKQRRLSLPVSCHPGTLVGDYVPFYFCPRSVMLHLLHRANHEELTYRGGQDPIIHLEADLHSVVAYFDSRGMRWAFSLGNAGAFYQEFRSDMAQLGEIDWQAVSANQWRAPAVKEAKQAEFLAHHNFRWALVSRIGVRSVQIKQRIDDILRAAPHRPPVLVLPGWYY